MARGRARARRRDLPRAGRASPGLGSRGAPDPVRSAGGRTCRGPCADASTCVGGWTQRRVQRRCAGRRASSPRFAARSRPRIEAATAGVPIVAPAGAETRPSFSARRWRAWPRTRPGAGPRARPPAATWRARAVGALGDALERDVYRAVVARRRRPAAADPLADRPFILCDLHMHTEHSHDCSVPTAALLDHAEEIGLGAIAITDHNVFAGAREAVETRTEPPAPRHPRRGGDDDRGRGDRALPRRGDPARHVHGGNDRSHP